MIIGFGYKDTGPRTIFDYENGNGHSHALAARNINPYLVDAADLVLTKRSRPIAEGTPEMRYGSMPIDKGSLILSSEERAAALAEEPQLRSWIRPYFGGEEFINATKRWCLWLVNAPPELLRGSAFIRIRSAKVKFFRSRSERKETVTLAVKPFLFGEIRQPASQYLLLPKVSSENRPYMPIGFMPPSAIASGSCLIVPAARPYHFGILTSVMHMAWMRAVCGRMKSDYQYSAGIVYNNFPWPEAPTEKQREAIEETAQGVLTARGEFPGSSLANLYDPLTMPVALGKAHQRLDKAVDAAYGYKGAKTDAERVAFLFGLFEKYTSLFPTVVPRPKRRAAPGAQPRRKTS